VKDQKKVDMNINEAKTNISIAKVLLESTVELEHEECKSKWENNSGEMCFYCQDKKRLYSLIEKLMNELRYAIFEIESTDSCVCQVTGESMVCQYEKMFEIFDKIVNRVLGKYVQIVNNSFWLENQGHIEEARENKEAVDDLMNSIGEYFKLRDNNLHGYQRNLHE